ncbi:MAG TPA: DUF5939 domain-containing protein, partial [Turneriella sp.]|nr:DUF5939 domain-containing protein [Turneriella sp.]
MHTSTETPTVSSFLQRYPWLPAETGGRKALDFLWRFRVKAPLEDLWPFLIDTSTFNRLLGLPEMQYEEKNGRLFGRSVNAGIVSEWEEVPWEWEYHKGLNNARIYSRGFATYVRSRYILAADGRETILQVYFGWVPRTWWGGLLLKIGMPRLRNDYERALGKIATIISERRDFAERQRSIQVLAAPVAANESAVTRMAALRQKAVTEGAPETALKKLCDYVLEAPEDELARIRIKVAARHLNENAGDLTAAALYATRVGILSLSWDVTCPHCRGVRESVTSLGDIPREGRCEACDITFSSEEIGNLEIVFHVNPEIRSVAKKFFCAAEPATKRHIRVQRRVAAGSELSLQTDLEPGEYR